MSRSPVGTPSSKSGPGASKLPKRMGRLPFFDPEISTWPLRGNPPLITNLSKRNLSERPVTVRSEEIGTREGDIQQRRFDCGGQD